MQENNVFISDVARYFSCPFAIYPSTKPYGAPVYLPSANLLAADMIDHRGQSVAIRHAEWT